MLALIAGQGRLPELILERHPQAVVFEMQGSPSGLPAAQTFRLEHLGTLLMTLADLGVSEVCFAGAIRRPPIAPDEIDPATAPLVPRVMLALTTGDDSALRTILGIFEEAGFTIQAAHELLPELLPAPGILTRVQPAERDLHDIEKGMAVVAELGRNDIGQAAVIAGGQVLALEAIGGTDWMLASIAGERRPASPPGGVLVKAPKPGQDRRADLPVIGKGTVAAAAAAGLNGICVEAGGVMLIDADDLVTKADEAGLFLWVRSAG